MATITAAPQYAWPFKASVSSSRYPILLLIPWCVFLFFYGLSAGELYRTENLRAIIASEFLRSGDWIVPRLYDEPLFTKPPGMYAAIALVSWPSGGVTEWTARLPSALAASMTVLLFYWYFARQLGRLAGLVAAAILPMSIMWLDKAPSAEIDMLQVAWVAAAILFFLRAIEKAPDKQRHRWWLASLLCVAGGVLTKWTAPVFYYATVLTLLWRRGHVRLLWGRMHLFSVSLAAGICLAWIAAAVWRTGWDEFYGTVSREAFQRLWPPDHYQAQMQLAPHHDQSFYPWQQSIAHPFKLWAMNLPWSAFALVALWPGFARLWDARGQQLLQALHCWVWPNVVFWSIIPEHASRHSAPLFPGIAGLAAIVWFALTTGKLRFRRSDRTGPGWSRALAACVVCWLVVKLAFVQIVIPQRNPTRAPKEKGEQLAALVPPGKPLYLFHLKDEGIMFYYSRLRSSAEPPVRRLKGPNELPSFSEPVYCILDEPEWRQWKQHRSAEVLLHLEDEQKAPIVLVRCQ
jgi:4-amino-4-deoxy-L-arabinose transferase-like glycosyltransferase